VQQGRQEQPGQLVYQAQVFLQQVMLGQVTTHLQLHLVQPFQLQFKTTEQAIHLL
jgi:hypothetical protein